jgi:hypothetical protein
MPSTYLYSERFRDSESLLVLLTLQRPLQPEVPELDDMVRMFIGLDLLDSLWSSEYPLYFSFFTDHEYYSDDS